MDELPEMPRGLVDSMRQPLEERQIQVARNSGSVVYPAEFMLVAAMNPCPCGYFPDRNRCSCTETQIRRYMGKLSGPIVDRMDLCVELGEISIGTMNEKKGEDSLSMRARVELARRLQQERLLGTDYRFNGDIRSADMEHLCFLGEHEKEVMEKLYERLRLSGRTYHRLLRVARTIADLEQEEKIREEHLLEAACYRPAFGQRSI